MEHVDPETLEALNALLQDERASVEVEVALSNGATERAEREMLISVGGEEVALCCALREHLAATGAPVTRHVNGIVLTIISTERYDDRLRAFATHQAASGERSQQLSRSVNNYELRQLLEDIHDAHVRSSLWAEHRATQFTHSRLMEFRAASQGFSDGSFYGDDAATSFRGVQDDGGRFTTNPRNTPVPPDGSDPYVSYAPPDPYDAYPSAERMKPYGEQDNPNDSYRSLATREPTYPGEDE